MLLNYKTASDFQAQFIQPLLGKLGFLQVVHSPGPREHANRFYFADFDKFQHIRYFAAHIQIGDIGVDECDDVIAQVKACFGVKLKNPKEAETRRISAAYIMTTGQIWIEARKSISDACLNEKYRENVYCLDGDRLEDLDRYHNIVDDRQKRSLLSGLGLEVERNLELLTILNDRLKTHALSQLRSSSAYVDRTVSMLTGSMFRSFTIQTILTRHIEFREISVGLLDAVFMDVSFVSTHCDEWLADLLRIHDDETLRETIKDHVADALYNQRELKKEILRALEDFDRKRQFTVDLVEGAD